MKLSELVADYKEQDGDLTVYARSAQGRFSGDSEVVLLSLTDKEHDMDVDEVAAKYCPGFDYFMEMFMIQEMADEMKSDAAYDSLEKRVERILYFQENDE